MSAYPGEPQTGPVLLVEDDEELLSVLSSRLRTEGFDVSAVTSGEAALECLHRQDFEAMATDLDLGGGLDGLSLAERVIALRDLPVVVMTGYDSYNNAIAALRTGVFDFLAKPVSLESLSLALTRAVRHNRMVSDLHRLREGRDRIVGDYGILGESKAIREVHSLIARVGPSDISVLITGESGTGKELVARALHESGPRRSRPFVPINCAAMPEQLLESELFGHTKGAFTDAKEDQTGLFVQASGGTLFLDEIGDMPLGMQAKLLRALQEERVRPVGGKEEIPFDTRVISATNSDLEEAIDDGRFREDLFYRLNVVTIHTPPLRAREQDVLLIAQAFIEEQERRKPSGVKGLSRAAAEKLLNYRWPGNVRELSNVIARAMVLTQFDELGAEDLPANIQRFMDDDVAVEKAPELISLEELERRHIHRVLRATSGNRSQASTVLGIDRRTLYRKIKRYGLDLTSMDA
ncbi:MAG: sigma-54-dependent transcriptional regulator [Myxococcota bacterium]